MSFIVVALIEQLTTEGKEITMILTECDLIKALKSEYFNCFMSQMKTDDMRDHIDKWLNEKLYTAGNNPRYRKGFIKTILPLRWFMIDELKGDFVVFGYWFEGEFYTTHNKRHELVKKYGLKTTDTLHDLKLDQSVWDDMEKGVYYANSKKRYFEG